jgi:hypothetical protein
MALESASYISELTATNPTASDSVAQGDDHLRMLKTVLKTQFSGLTGTTAIASSEAELNILDGVTATAAELNYLDITTLGTSADSKALTQASGVVTIVGDVKITGTTPLLTIGDAGAEDTTLLFDGNAQDYYIALDDSADDLLIGLGSTVGTTPAISIDENLAVKTYGDITMTGTTPTLTIGDAGAEDTKIVFDGNAKDFYVALDDSADKLVIGEGSTVGTNSILTVTDDTVTVGDGAAVDTYINFDGNAVDYRIGLDDGTDKLEIGAGVAHGTTAAIAIDSAADMIIGGYINFQDEQAIRPEIKDYAETVNAIGGTGGGTQDIDLTAGNVVTATVDTSTNTFTFSNPSATGKACSFTLILTNGGSQTVNWPGAVDWKDGTAPTLTSSGVDILTFTTVDAGTIWYGFHSTDMK